MTSRERVLSALNRKVVDRPAVQYYYSEVGYYEHGELLNELYKQYPGDFEPWQKKEIPKLAIERFDANGKYHFAEKDEWGTEWEYLVYGMMGHVRKPAIINPKDYLDYKFPRRSPLIYTSAEIEQYKKQYPVIKGEGFSFLERLSNIRGFEDALIDLMEDTEEVNIFLNNLTEYYLQRVYEFIKMGADCITFGDDYGTQQNLIISRDLFRDMIKPRLKKIMDPIKKAGINIHFHSCGKIDLLFEDFKDIGVTSIWPQLPVYDMKELKAACDQYSFSLAIHTDRADTMTLKKPEDVKELVHKEFDIFRPDLGNSWFYIEVDTGFPFENIKALVETVASFKA